MKLNLIPDFLWRIIMCSFYGIMFQVLCMGVIMAKPADAQSTTSIKEITIDLKMKGAGLEEVFNQIETQTGFHLVYNKSVINDDIKIRRNIYEASLYDYLLVLSEEADLAFQRINDVINVKKVKTKNKEIKVVEFLETKRISGKVTDAETSEPLAGVSIRIQGTTVGTVTDAEGRFTVLVPEEAKVLIFSFVGYVSEEINIENLSEIDVALSVDVQTLENLVVVGYGTQRKINLTGAVDQVAGETFENRPLPNISQGLQGVVPNLNITIQDGKPIQSPEFNIRGTTSIGQGGNALVLIDGVEGDPSLINPNDIASISVLKDAASASIYGARGAFGVILITTKDPQQDKMSVTYTGNFSTKKPTTVPELVTNGYQWATLFNEAWSAWNDYSQTPQNVNKTMRFSQEYLEELKRRDENPNLPKTEVDENGNYVYYHNTDWFDELYKNSLTAMEHNVTVSGRGDKTSFLVTGRYFDQEGLFRYNSDDYKMYNFRAKGSLELNPWLTLDNNTQYSSMKYHNPLNVGEGGSIWRNIADEGHVMAPLLNPDGTLSYSAAYTVGDFYYGKNGIDMNERVLRNTTGFTAEVLKDKLRIKGNFTFQNTDNKETRLRVPVPYSRKPGVIEYVGTNTNDIREISNDINYITTNLYGEYENVFSDRHYFKALLGYNYEQSTYESLTVQRNDLIFEDANDLNLAFGQSISTAGGYEKWNILGGFFRLNYIFDDKYLLEINGRYDGSSKFPADERFAFFPSVSAGWRISEESFWNVSENIISDLKLRGSYGSLGNGNIESYAFLEQFSITQSSLVLNGVRPQKTNQPSVIPDGLTWETSTTSNIGLDFAMVSGKLTFSGDAYIRRTTDMFTVGRTLPAVYGTQVPKGNYADLETKGWEFVLGWQDAFMVGSEPFNYNVRFTLADNQSEITKFNNEDKILNDYYKGMKVGEIWGYTTEGFFTSVEDISNHADQTAIKASTSGTLLPGDIKFKDVNGDGVINNGANTVDDPGDLTIIGNTTPRYNYGVMLGADWNNFFFSAFFMGVGKQDWWPGREADLFWGKYNRPYNDTPVSQVDEIWSEENPDTYFPRLRGYTALGTDRELAVTQTKYLQNIAFIRLKNLQIGYNVPGALAEKIRARSARIYLTAENLWSWSPLYKITRDLDVENTGPSDLVLTSGTSGSGNNYPMLKSFTLGLSVTF